MAASPSTVSGRGGGIDFRVPDELAQLVEQVRAFVDEEVLPVEADLVDPDDFAGNWPVVERLREEARRRGIFAPHLPEAWGGLDVNVTGMSLISEVCGASTLASLALNAMAPDEGNMHTLLVAATEDQKERWLRPLAEGRMRSCFAMTEPDVASSDPLNLRTTAVRDGEEWVLNGRKWFATGAIGAAFAIVVAKTGEGSGHRDYSLILVPCDTPGWTVVRDPGLMGAHFVGGHPEIELRDVRVPVENLLGDEGDGFTISQKRLAAGRLAHAMRWIGAAQRALDLMTARLLERSSFGRDLADHQALQFFVADSAMDLYASRLMVLHTAWKADSGIEHRQEVSMTKTFVSEAFGRILDRAVQVFGSHGIATDEPVGRWYSDARAARIYDGASEIHRVAIARRLIKLASLGESTRAACGEVV